MKDILNSIKDEMTTSNFETAESIETAEYFDNMDAEDFEQMEQAEYAEYLDFLDALEDAEHKKRKRLGLFTGKKKRGHRLLHRKKGQKKAHVKPLKGRAKLAAIGGGGSYAGTQAVSQAAPTFGSPSFINKTMTDSVGDLNITITRETSKVPFNLPYILFDLNGYSSNYISTIRQYLPGGVTMTASADPATGDVLLTYTDGVNTDIVRISLTGSQISYSEFLQSMNQNFFKTHYVRQEYQNDNTLLLQVSQTIRFGLLSSLGMKNANNLLPRSRRLNSDYQTNIINLFLPEQQITADFSFVQNIIRSGVDAPVVLAWDIFMSERTNMNNAAFNH
jgi:hypothetical protein